MKPSGWNRLPLWARYFGILLGVPFVIAFVRVALERRFDRFTSDIVVIILLIIASILLFWKRKGRRNQPHADPMTREDRQHEQREELQLAFLMFIIFTIVLLTGTFFGFCIMFSALPAGYTEALYFIVRFFGAVIGLVALLMTFVCYEQAKAEFLLLQGRKPHSSVSVSRTAVLFTLAIVLAIAYAIVKLGHL